MSVDALSALAVDDLGRNLLGWQLVGWQFEIAHEPLTVSFLEPGASYVQPPSFEPIPSHMPGIATDDPVGEDLPHLPSASGLNDAFVTPGPQNVAAEAASVQPGGFAPQDQAGPLYAGAGADIAGSGSGGGFHVLPPYGGFAAPVTLVAHPVQVSAHESAPSAPTPDQHEQIPVSDVTDFFEFNVILQINVLLDNDFVGQIAAGHAPYGCDTGFSQWAMTGGNTQSNHAVIADSGDYGDFGWLGGSYYESNTIHSVNALDDGDFGFNVVSGGGSGTQSIVSGGNAQTNEAMIVSLTQGEGAVPGHVEIGAADHVEYNIVTQVNFMDDADIVAQQAAGGGYGTQAVSSGGNTQSNSALLIDDNNAPSQDIQGNYYEYNMIVQANLMNDSDQVAQTLAADPHGHDSNLLIEDDALAYGLIGDAIA